MKLKVKRPWILVWVVLLVLIAGHFSCQPENTTSHPKPEFPGVKLKITQSAGDVYKDFKYLPLLGNLSKVSDTSKVEVLILSKPLEAGDEIAVDPVAMLRYLINDQEYSLIVAIPTNPSFQSIKISNLVELSVEYASIKRIIEHWYGSFSGMGQSKIITWENKTTAKNVLNNEFLH